MSQQIDAMKHAQWAKRLRLFSSSGMSIREFCRRQRLSEPNFYFWRRQLSARAAGTAGMASKPRHRAKPASANSVEPRRGHDPLFVPVRVTASPKASGPAHPRQASLSGSATPSEGRIDLLLEGGVTIRLRGSVPPERLAEVLAVLDRRGGRPC